MDYKGIASRMIRLIALCEIIEFAVNLIKPVVVRQLPCSVVNSSTGALALSGNQVNRLQSCLQVVHLVNFTARRMIIFRPHLFLRFTIEQRLLSHLRGKLLKSSGDGLVKFPDTPKV